jgi:hypothetical protein
MERPQSLAVKKPNKTLELIPASVQRGTLEKLPGRFWFVSVGLA